MSIIGRAHPADLVAPGQQVSHRHAEIVHLGGDQYRLTDLDSSNGTWVNGHRISSCTVRASDDVRLGSYAFDLAAHLAMVPRVDAPPVWPAAAPWPAPPAPAPAGPGAAWDRAAEIGFAAAFFRTLGDVAARPVSFFRSLAPAPGPGGAFGLYVLCACLLGVASVVQMILLPVVMHGAPLQAVLRELSEGRVAATLMVFAVAYPVFAALGFWVAAGIDHGMLRLFSSTSRPFATTARVLGYGQGLCLVIGTVPLVGWVVAAVHGVVLRIIGYSEAHGITRGRAAAAVLVPGLVLGLLVALAFYATGGVLRW